MQYMYFYDHSTSPDSLFVYCRPQVDLKSRTQEFKEWKKGETDFIYIYVYIRDILCA